MRKLSIALRLLLITLVFSSTQLFSQSKNDKIKVGKVGKENITYGELKNNYTRGSADSPTLLQLEEFLPIYLNYKAKIQNAKDLGYFEDPELLSEYEIYAKQAAYSYWLENRIKPTEFEEYYKKAGSEVKSQHVLISVSEDASPQDTLKAYNSLIEARNKYLAGQATMEELNQQYSSTRQGQLMGGDLPWFGVGTTVAPFEEAIYSLDIDEISMPVRTQFGYHIILLTGKRESVPARNVSHIFLRAEPKENLEKINDIYSNLEKGLPWVVATADYSQDKLSSEKSGNIGWVKFGRNFNSDFVDVIMKVDPSLPYSKPIKTVYGYHIFKIDSVETFKSDDERKESFMKEFLSSPNFKKSNSFVLSWMKDNYSYKPNMPVLKNYISFISSKDTTRFKAISNPTNSSEKLFSVHNETINVGDYHKFIVENYGSARAIEYRNEWLDAYVDKVIDEQLIPLVVKEFPEFEKQLYNYKVGLSVYKINDDNIWGSANVDSSALWKIYNENPTEYSFKERSYYYLLSSNDSTLLDAVDFVKAGNEPDSIRAYYPKVAVLRDSSGIQNEEYHDMLANLKPSTFSKEFEYKKRKSYLYLNDILPARKMTFDESFNRLLATYQPEREKNWNAKLHNKYKVKADLKNLRKAFKEEHSN
tara:strand:- start:3627 stop:5564 length:1938 start_codon:yes stop_codon:yes gene_type:complete